MAPLLAKVTGSGTIPSHSSLGATAGPDDEPPDPRCDRTDSCRRRTAERQREVFLARRNVNDKTFQERFGDRRTSGEVNPYAPGFREGDCTQR